MLLQDSLNFGDRLDHLKDRLHFSGRADDIFHAASFSLGTFESTVLVDERLPLKRFFNDYL